MRKLVSSLKNDPVGSLCAAVIWTFVAFWFGLFAIAVVCISIGTPEQRGKAYEIIVPGASFNYHCNDVARDGDALILTGCVSNSKIVIEHQSNVQIIERRGRDD